VTRTMSPLSRRTRSVPSAPSGSRPFLAGSRSVPNRLPAAPETGTEVSNRRSAAGRRSPTCERIAAGRSNTVRKPQSDRSNTAWKPQSGRLHGGEAALARGLSPRVTTPGCPFGSGRGRRRPGFHSTGGIGVLRIRPEGGATVSFSRDPIPKSSSGSAASTPCAGSGDDPSAVSSSSVVSPAVRPVV
jgi:hypothetical protein